MIIIHRKKQKFRQPFYRRAIFKKLIIVIFLLIVLICLLLFSPLFRCEEVNIRGDYITDGEELKNFVIEALGRNISRSLLWPLNDLSEDLKSNFPYIENIKISRKWPNAIEFILTEKKPSYCVILPMSQRILIDQNYSFLEQLKGDCPPNLPIISYSKREENIYTEEGFFSEEIKKIIIGVKETIHLFPNLILRRFEIDKFYVKAMVSDVEIKSGWFIYLNQMNDIPSQIHRLELFLRTKTEEELILLDYVDVGSHKERVFYAIKSD